MCTGVRAGNFICRAKGGAKFNEEGIVCGFEWQPAVDEKS